VQFDDGAVSAAVAHGSVTIPGQETASPLLVTLGLFKGIIGTELNETVVSDVYLPEMNLVFANLEFITVNGDTYSAESVS